VSFEIIETQEEHAAALQAATDIVAREKKYFLRTEAPSVEKTLAFIQTNQEKGNPFFVAMADGKLAGWCGIERAAHMNMAHVGRLAIGILPDYREQGMGTALMKKVLAAAKERGMIRIDLSVYADNERALALYKKMGFVVEGIAERDAKIDGAYRTCVLMVRFEEDA